MGVQEYCTGKAPSTRAIMAGDKVTGKSLDEWARISCIDGVLYRKLRKNGDTIQQLLLPEALSNWSSSHGKDSRWRVPDAIVKVWLVALNSRPYCNICRRCMLAKAGKTCRPTIWSLRTYCHPTNV